nr:acetyl-CoA C-acyltransferase [Actinomycetes bacterium]
MSAPTSANEAFIYDVLRTPRGKGKPGGSLYEVKPVELVSGLLKEIAERNPSYDPGRVDDVVLGCVTPVGDQGADIAKISSMVA